MIQNWDKNVPTASRFTVLAEFNNEAVRDNNTGLVWERAPDGTTRSWGDAAFYLSTSMLAARQSGGYRQ